jgi:hypothetical protein
VEDESERDGGPSGLHIYTAELANEEGNVGFEVVTGVLMKTCIF